MNTQLVFTTHVQTVAQTGKKNIQVVGREKFGSPQGPGAKPRYGDRGLYGRSPMKLKSLCSG